MAQFLIKNAARVAASWTASFAQRQIATLFAPDVEGPRQAELQVQTSTEGAPVPIVYGRMRLAGQLIWAARFNESSVTRSTGGGKGGGPKSTEYRYSVSFAVGLCEGEIGGIGRVWADGSLLVLEDVSWRIHTGSESQRPDPLIEAIEGAEAAPAYRGLAYVVFEDLPLEAFGNRIPNLSFEVLAKPTSDETAMEQRLEGVCLIPSSGEFAYADRAVMRTVSEGEERPENHHTTRASCDLEASLDDLQARLPNCGSVALVTAWFGSDLRADHCTLTPRVETRDKDTHPLIWSVAGLSRAEAQTVTEDGGSPVYGGTPSDETVLQAISALKARGLDVTLYPFILMDIPGVNALPDPYGEAEQAVFPWRGRITCDPAPGQPGSPDKTADATAQIQSFFGSAAASDFQVDGTSVTYTGPQEWSFNRFILHHAALAKAAGGVESFIIGSEMRALTQVRDGLNSYPAVQKLVALAAEVRNLLGPNVKLSYAADWSEYSGHAPDDGSGDRLFHLDPLWASAEIDFVGIDWYAPLSDWRDGGSHLDQLSGAASIYDPTYLASQVEGGEGFDWFYASDADRDAQLRTPITDGAHAEPWVFRYKDLRSWWGQPHHERIGGVRQLTSTAWIPQSKPVRLVELGCPAIDKGANQPNVFLDPKSAESSAPYYSSGARDDLIQRRYIEALLGYWETGTNPVSSLYGGPMLDLQHCHVWTWDARPFPEFPTREDVWADGPNWRLGHWLTGRAGQSLIGELVSDLAARAGLEGLETTGVDGVLAGYTVSPGVRARDEIERLGSVFGFDIVDRASGPVCVPHQSAQSITAVHSDALVVEHPRNSLTFARDPYSALPGSIRLQFFADDGDYQPASVSAQGLNDLHDTMVDFQLPALCDRDLAAGWAQDMLCRASLEVETGQLKLPPSQMALEAGDLVSLNAGPVGRRWRLASADGMADRRCDFVGGHSSSPLVQGPDPKAARSPRPLSRPALSLLDLPMGPDGEPRHGLGVVAWADPWPGPVALYAGGSIETATQRVLLTAPGFLGTLVAPLEPGFEGRWDKAGTVRILMKDGAFASAESARVLDGANRVAIETQEGWEVLSFAQAELESDGSWSLSRLLRGLGGSPSPGAGAGSKLVVLDTAADVLPVHDREAGSELTILAVPPGKSLDHSSVRRVEMIYAGIENRPLAPVHLRSSWSGLDLELSWIRRARRKADAWAYGEVDLDEAREAYEVKVFEGGTPVLTQQVETTRFTFTAALQAALFPDGLENATVTVAQISDRFGPGRTTDANLQPPS